MTEENTNPTEIKTCPFHGEACTSDPPWDGITCGQVDPSSEAEVSSESPPETPPGTPPPQWEYRTSFKIVGRLKEVVNLTMDVTQQEIARYRKKIAKLTYGS